MNEIFVIPPFCDSTAFAGGVCFISVPSFCATVLRKKTFFPGMLVEMCYSSAEDSFASSQAPFHPEHCLLSVWSFNCSHK